MSLVDKDKGPTAHKVPRLCGPPVQIGKSKEYDKNRIVENEEATLRSTRSTTTNEANFDWLNYCFICGERCSIKHRPGWSMVVDSKGESNMYTKLFNAALRHQDHNMVLRLSGVPNQDLVTVKARYHRKKNCFVRYVNQRSNISHTITPNEENVHEKAVIMLIDEFQHQIEDKQVFLLSNLRDRLHQLLRLSGYTNPDAYTSQKLKRQLTSRWSDVSFFPQPGASDIVCSNSITVGEVLQKATKLMKRLNDSRPTNANSSCENHPFEHNERRIVHEAVGILRKRISRMKRADDNTYFSVQEMSLEKMKEYVDPLLYNAIGWLTKKSLFDKAANLSEQKPDLRCINIACDISTLTTSVTSPKHLGLAVTLHHAYGSRKLIDIMHANGYSISYSEVRRFLTSAALYVNSLQDPSTVGSYNPPEISRNDDGNHFIVAAADNWDHNERTIDGKNTTHAMTSIFIQQDSGMTKECPRLVRAHECSLDALESLNLSTVLHYEKPFNRPQPVFNHKVSIEDVLPNKFAPAVKASEMVDIVYNIARSGKLQNREIAGCVPPWGIYHAMQEIQEKKTSIVSFNPILMANPTEFSTVYTTLRRAKESLNNLGQSFVPVFFDMGLLSKALEITWACPEELAGVIPCEGGMHLLMSVFSSIGYIYGDAGLKNLLHESGVFAKCSVEQMLTGRDFDRALYALEILDESLNSVFYSQFTNWCIENSKQIPDAVVTSLNNLDETFTQTKDVKLVVEAVTSTCEDVERSLLQLLTSFRDEGRALSPTFRFWDDFLCKVLKPFKQLVSSTRLGQWDVQQSAKADLLPLLFAANRTNYSRYMPVMLILMKGIPSEVLKHFKDGQFVAKLSTSKFNGVWVDYTLETTENKSLKGNGGIIGLTKQDKALHRWFLSRPVTAQYSLEVMQNCSHSRHNSGTYHRSGKSSMKRWNDDVQKLVQMFDGAYIDPFNFSDPPERLVNIATGAVASPAIQESLVNVLSKGTSMVNKFVSERLIGNQKGERKSLYDVIPRSKIKTMADMRKKVKISKRTVSMDGEIMYLRLMAVNSRKQVPLERVMMFENAPVPLSIFTEEGTIVSCLKSDFMHKLEELVADTSTEVISSDAIIFDGHAVVQSLPPSFPANTSFHHMADTFLRYIIRQSKYATQIHVTFDQYLDSSIKNQTRGKRGNNFGAAYHIKLDIAIPNWKRFLSNSKNKASLAFMYTNYMADNAPAILGNQLMYVSGGDEQNAIRISSRIPTVSNEQILKSNHEEADTRMIFHAVTAANRGADSIIVCSPDTDVLVLLVHHRPAIHASKIYLLTGRVGKNSKSTRYIPVHEIYNKLNTIQHSILLSVYCLTGCDTVSSFYGHGKKTAFRIMMQKPNCFTGIATLGKQPTMTNEEKQTAMSFVCALYGKFNCFSLNALRSERVAKQKNVNGKKLPPTEDSFFLHLRRCLYQLMIWREAIIPIQEEHSPLDFGYEIADDSLLQPKMMSQSPAAPELLNDIVCDCVANSCDADCTCLKNQQPCTASCNCKASSFNDCSEDFPPCSNPLTYSATNADSDSEGEAIEE